MSAPIPDLRTSQDHDSRTARAALPRGLRRRDHTFSGAARRRVSSLAPRGRRTGARSTVYRRGALADQTAHTKYATSGFTLFGRLLLLLECILRLFPRRLRLSESDLRRRKVSTQA